MTVHPSTPPHEKGVFIEQVLRRGRWGDVSRNGGEAVSLAQLIGEEHADVERPGRSGDVATREPGRELVVDVEDREHLQGGEAVQGDEEDEGEAVVEGGALLEAGVALFGD